MSYIYTANENNEIIPQRLFLLQSTVVTFYSQTLTSRT